MTIIKSALSSFLRILLLSVVLLFCSFTFPQDWNKIVPEASKIGYDVWFKKFGSTVDTLKINIIGDVMMHQRQIDVAKRPDGTYDFSTYFEHMEEDFKNDDLTIANMEFTLGGKPYKGYPAFSAPDNYPDYAADMGIDIFLTANNHILDKGVAGLKRTLNRYDQMQAEGRIMHTGCCLDKDDFEEKNPLILVKDGVKLAVINFTYGTNSPISVDYPHINKMAEKDLIKKSIDKARESKVDIIIAIPHWGAEYALKHGSDQGKMARWLAENGVDVIVGAHTHCVEDREMIEVRQGDGTVRKVPVYYSVGNAIHNMDHNMCQLEIMVTLSIEHDINGSVRLLEPHHTWLWCSHDNSFTDNYALLKYDEFVGHRELWKTPADYDKMVSEYKKISKATGLE